MRKKLMLAIFFLLCGFLLQKSYVFAGGNAHALIITRGDYDNPRLNLSPGPENDGKNFGRILQRAYGKSLNMTVLAKKGAQSVEEVTEAIQTAFKDSTDGDVNYFYYSGHGGEEGMWLGGWQYLNAKDLAQAFSGVRGTNFLVIDCCYSGNLISRSVPEETFASRFINQFETELSQRQSRSAITNDSFHVLVASAEGQESLQSGLGIYGEEMGYFTSAISAGCGIDFSKVSFGGDYLCAAMADRNRDGNVSFQELYEYVSSMMFVSEAQVYPKQDETYFVPVDDSRVPDTVITGVEIGYDLDGIPFLETAYDSDTGGELLGALYPYEKEEALWDSLMMTVETEVDSYPVVRVKQSGEWRFTAEEKYSRAALPLGAGDLEEGNYLLLIRKKDGNTGCYLFPVMLERRAESGFLRNMALQIADFFSIEKDGTLEITADFGTCNYSNQYDCRVSCSIQNERGKTVRTLPEEYVHTEMSEQAYHQLCSFQWDGKRDNGMQAAAGNYTITVSAQYGNRMTEQYRTIQVESAVVSDKISIAGLPIQLLADQYIYDGIEKCPDVMIKGLKNGLDYTVSYERNRNAGQGTVRITGIGDYCGTVVRNFTILPMYVSGLQIHVQKKLSCTGKALRPAVRVSYNGTVLKEGTDYRLSYSNNRKSGLGKVTIWGTGNYTGRITKQFQILPGKPGKVKAEKKGNTVWLVRWKKGIGADGYELRYSTDRNFKKDVKKIQISGGKKCKISISVSKENKRYYFRIYSWKKINGKKLYSMDYSCS